MNHRHNNDIRMAVSDEKNGTSTSPSRLEQLRAKHHKILDSSISTIEKTRRPSRKFFFQERSAFSDDELSIDEDNIFEVVGRTSTLGLDNHICQLPQDRGCYQQI